MASRGGAYPARFAIDCYKRQSYLDRELIVVSADPDAEVAALIAELGDPSIRWLAAPAAASVGQLRNAAIAVASGDLISVWDDDDLSHPMRLQWQREALEAQAADACMLTRVLLWWPSRRRLAVGVPRAWENTLLAKRAALPAYSDVRRRSDTLLVQAMREAARRIVLLDRPDGYVYIAHGGNLWPDEHFEMLFANGQEVAAEAYESWLQRLGVDLPVRDYLERLAVTK